jgi:hypothetical protein
MYIHAKATTAMPSASLKRKKEGKGKSEILWSDRQFEYAWEATTWGQA